MAQFAVSLQHFEAKANGRMDIVVRKIALDLLTRFIRRTPVDKGRAQNNWNVAMDTPDNSTTTAAVLNQNEIIGELTAAVQKMKAGGSIFITNNLAYIEPLERGHSGQAPAGMVGITLSEYPGIVTRAATETNRGEDV